MTIMSATSITLVSTHIWYSVYVKTRKVIERLFKEIVGKHEGKYFKIREIHGERGREEVRVTRVSPSFMGYVRYPEGYVLRTPFIEVEVPHPTKYSKVVTGRPIESTVGVAMVELSSPTFRKELLDALSRVRRIRRMLELRG